MISIKPKIHDSNTLEFKVGYLPGEGATYNDFYMNTWIYIPEVLAGKDQQQKIYVL